MESKSIFGPNNIWSISSNGGGGGGIFSIALVSMTASISVRPNSPFGIRNFFPKVPPWEDDPPEGGVSGVGLRYADISDMTDSIDGCGWWCEVLWVPAVGVTDLERVGS